MLVWVTSHLCHLQKKKPVRNNFSNHKMWFSQKPRKIRMVFIGKLLISEELEEMSSCLTKSMVCFCWTGEHLSHWFPQPPFSADYRLFILPFFRPVNGLSHWVILKTQFFSMDCQDFWNKHHTWLRTKFKRTMDKTFLLKEIQLRNKFRKSSRKNWVLNCLAVYIFL